MTWLHFRDVTRVSHCAAGKVAGHSPSNRGGGQCTTLHFFFNSSSTDKLLKPDELLANKGRYVLTRFVAPVTLAAGGQSCPV